MNTWRPCLRTYLLLVRFHDAKKYIFLLNEFERNQIQKLVLHDHSIMLNKQFWKSVLYFSIHNIYTHTHNVCFVIFISDTRVLVSILNSLAITQPRWNLTAWYRVM